MRLDRFSFIAVLAVATVAYANQKIHSDGVSLSIPSCSGAGKALAYNSVSAGFECNTISAVGGSLPSGFIGLVTSGTCPTGTTEVAALNGVTLVGTLAANGDVGGTGGANLITPAGNNAGGAVSAHAGTAVADHASHTHTYTDVIAHTHVITSQTATTGGATSYEHGTLDTSSAEAEATEVTGSTGIATGTTAGPSATLTHTVTQPNAHTFTQPTFTGTQFDNRSAYVKVIFCSGN